MILGINGSKGAGKDTLGSYLVDVYGFERLSFASALKESAAALFDVPVEFWEDAKNNPNAHVLLKTQQGVHSKLTVREFLQRYGTEAHRDVFGSGFWVDFVLNKIPHSLMQGNYVITDARFDNELEAIQERGGVNIRVEREAVEVGDTHASESLPDFSLIDWFLDNNKDKSWLYNGADAIMKELGVKSRAIAA